MGLEEIYQASKKVNLWQVEECVVDEDSAVIKLDELVRIFYTNFIPKNRNSKNQKFKKFLLTLSGI